MQDSRKWIVLPCALAVIMECISGYHKLQDRLTDGYVAEHALAIEGAFRLIGRIHRATSLETLTQGEKQELMAGFE